MDTLSGTVVSLPRLSNPNAANNSPLNSPRYSHSPRYSQPQSRQQAAALVCASGHVKQPRVKFALPSAHAAIRQGGGELLCKPESKKCFPSWSPSQLSSSPSSSSSSLRCPSPSSSPSSPSARRLALKVQASAGGTAEAELPNTPGTPLPSEKKSLVRIHYHRDDGAYEGWGLHVWGHVRQPTDWHSPLQPAGQNDYGVFFDVEVEGRESLFNVLVHKGDEKDNVAENTAANVEAYWFASGYAQLWASEPDFSLLPRGNIHRATAYWLSSGTLALPPSILSSSTNSASTRKATLFFSASAALDLAASGVEKEDEKWDLQVGGALSGSPSASLLARFPFLGDYIVATLPAAVADDKEAVARIVKGQLAVGVTDGKGKPVDAMGLQIHGALDDVFKYDGPLGLEFSADGNVRISVWAPTAQSVKLLIFDTPTGGPPPDVKELKGSSSGVWKVSGPATWLGKYFQYEVSVFSPWTGKVETSYATDPYSRSLSANGERSHILDISKNEATMPAGWAQLAEEKPNFTSPTDMVIYELHIRDFSAGDQTVSESVRGGYLAFAQESSAGTKHLKRLAEAGVSHVHLLPSFDFATVNERKSAWKTHKDLSSFPPDSEEQQAAVTAIANEDGFNWGYDPVHYSVPDGSYATDPDGAPRILEYRTMVQALNRLGLRVVVDVVYNHLNSSGPHAPHSVFDKIVPGYYLRRSPNGDIEASTCMNNTASENYMFGRFIRDDLLHWALDFKVDGFRFDLMGHIMKDVMVSSKEALEALTVDKDGVDGSSLYLYGEGWDFGEVAGNRLGVNAGQMNLYGTGIGSFNDRIREAATGGTPFGDPRTQGFVTGLALEPNGFDQGDDDWIFRKLANETDVIRVGLAGNLRDFVFNNSDGKEVRASEIKVGGGAPCGYAGSPSETINYVSAHDNETLFDVIMWKAPAEVDLAGRIRMNWMADAIIALGQGIPFFHAGDELLRSKSLDRDSYNSGDWFNKLDFTYNDNNFGVGLPPQGKNGHVWDLMRPKLADPSMKPSKAQILATVDNFCDLLKIRGSSPLLRLSTKEEVQARVEFLSGASNLAGVIGMLLYDYNEEDYAPDDPVRLSQLDDNYKAILVVFNTRPEAIYFKSQDLLERNLLLHPILKESSDPLVRTAVADGDCSVFVPPRTTAVFVEPR